MYQLVNISGSLSGRFFFDSMGLVAGVELQALFG